MEWGYIITALVSLITGGGLLFLINPKAAKKKPEIENKNANAEADHTIVQTAKDLLDGLKEDRNDMDARYDRLEEKYDAKTKELDETNSNLVMCSMLICRNVACPLRSPSYGQGKIWLENYIHSKEFTDSTAIEDIAESKGYKLQRTKKASVTE